MQTQLLINSTRQNISISNTVLVENTYQPTFHKVKQYNIILFGLTQRISQNGFQFVFQKNC